MRNVHITQAAFVGLVVDALRRADVPINRYLNSSGLNQFELDSPDAFVPTRAFFDLLDGIAKNETGGELPLELIRNYRLTELGAWGQGILGCPDVLTASLAASLPEARTFSHETLDLRIDGSTSYIRDHLSWGSGLPQEWIEQFILHLVVDGLRAGGGHDWLPSEVHVTTDKPSSYTQQLAEAGVSIRLGEPKIMVAFPTRLLGEPMQSDAADDESAAQNPTMPNTTASRIEALVNATSHSRPLTVEEFARQLELSSRTLQRLLADEAETFSGVIENWRLKRALQLLARERSPVSEISERLHYGHTSNFVRAFKRWTNTTPQAYRDQLVGRH